MPYEELTQLLAGAEIHRRQDKEATLKAYLLANTYEEITTAQIAEIMQVSNQTARKYTEDHPDWFRALRRGVWEIRNPKDDRR